MNPYQSISKVVAVLFVSGMVVAAQTQVEKSKDPATESAPSQTAQQVKPVETGSISNLGTDTVALRQRIENALHNDSSLSGSAITVNVTDDTVELSGVVNNGKERTAARRIAQSFAGNLRLRDCISVPGSPAPSAGADFPQSDQLKEKSKAEAPATESQSDLDKKAKRNRPKADPVKKGDQSEEPRR